METRNSEDRSVDPEPVSRQRVIQWWPWAVGAGLLTTLIFAVGPQPLISTFARVKPGWAACVILISVIWLLLGGFNIWLLLTCLTPVPLRSFQTVYFTSWGTALLLPGQMGDATQILLLKRYGIAVQKSSAAYLVDKFFSLTWLLLVAAYGIAIYAPEIPRWFLPTVYIVGVLIAVFTLALARRLRFQPHSRPARVQTWIEHLIAQLWAFRHYPGTLLLNIFFTLVKWGMVAVLYELAFRAFGTSVGFQAAATIPVISSLVGHLPVTVGGAGTMEWTGVFLFSRIGAEQATVLSVYLFLRGILMVIVLVPVGNVLAQRRRTSKI